MSEQIESQDEDDRRLIEVKESVEDWDDRSDHIDADEPMVDWEVERTEAWGIGCQVFGLEDDALLIAPHILTGLGCTIRGLYSGLREHMEVGRRYGGVFEFTGDAGASSRRRRAVSTDLNRD